MTKIVITIEVEGGNVSVNTGGQRASTQRAVSNTADKPFVERPEPEYPDWDPACPVHGVDWKLIKAGVSKTAKNADGTPKRYNAFYACPERGCSEKPEWKPDDDSAVDVLGF